MFSSIRLASMSAALTIATAAFLSSAPVALMAPVTRDICGNAESDVSYTFDDTTRVITDIIVTNDSSRHSLTAVAIDPNTGVVVWSGTRSFNAGTFDFNIAPRNILMVQRTAKDGSTYLQSPYNLGCQWS